MIMAVEQILQHNLGKAIKDVHELGVQHGRCRSKSPALRQLDSYRLDASLDVDVEDPKATIMWNHTHISPALQTRKADMARVGHLGALIRSALSKSFSEM